MMYQLVKLNPVMNDMDEEYEIGEIQFFDENPLTPIREVWEKHKNSAACCVEDDQLVFDLLNAISQTMAIVEGK